MDRRRPDLDWRDAGAYAALLGAERSIFAWEWLRRDPAYRAAVEASMAWPVGAGPSSPDAWGLHVFEPPDLAAPEARPVWTAHVHPPVLEAMAEPSGHDADLFDISRLGPLARIVAAPAREHLLISDGLRAIRVDILGGSLREGPVRLRFLIPGLAGAERPLLTLRKLLALHRGGRFSPALHPRDVRAGRFILMLRAHDAHEAGATQREIAMNLLSAEAAAARWRVSAPTLRASAQRLVRAARRMAAGGYVSLLG